MVTKEQLIEFKNLAVAHKPDNYQMFLALLAKHMDCKVIVELGIARLVTTNMLAESCSDAVVIGVDIDNGQFSNLQHDNIVLVRGDSIECAKDFIRDIDLLFIDAEHTYTNTMGNYNAWKPFVRDGGIICFDDTNCPSEFPELLRIPQEIEGFIELNELHWSGFGCVINKK
jgi:predicted O-methyltransferase YrrM